MNKMKFLTISVIILLLLNAFTLFMVFHMHPARARGPHDGEDPATYIIKQLKLDDQQQQQFAELRNHHHEITKAAEDEDKRLHDLYFNMLKTDNPDKNKVDSVAILIGEKRKELAIETFDHFQQLRAICRDDQKKLFDATIDDITHMVTGERPPLRDAPPR